MRRDIQSLRGLAILAVLLFHLGFSQVRGGFLGVDLFFVISGFVITSRLNVGEGSKRRQITTFYQNRAKRILPASLAVTALISIANLYFLSPISLHSISQEALGASLFSANIVFLLHQNNYLNSTLDVSPFLHYWSLGVEEQFYVVWPILFLFFFRKHKKFVLPLFFILGGFAIWYTQFSPISSFYSPLSRAWEFLAGALISLAVPPAKITKVHKVAVFAALAILIASFFIVSANMATPGWSTIFPVVAAMFIIRYGFEVRQKNPMVWLGDISFTLYLVHWPVVIFLFTGRSSVSLLLKIEALLISLVLAVVVTKLVETPFRFRPKLKLSLAKWGVVLVVVSSGSFALLSSNASLAVTQVSGVKIDSSLPIIYSNGCHLEYQIDWPTKPCLFGDLTSNKLVILAGDSHAAQWFPAVAQLANSQHWKLLSLTKSSCPAILLATNRSGVPDLSCQRWQQSLITTINSEKPALVLLSNFTQQPYQLVQAKGTYLQDWQAGELAFISKLKVAPGKVVIVGDTPKPASDSISCLTAPAHKKNLQACDFTNVPTDLTAAIPAWTKNLNINFIDPVNWFCAKNLCPAVVNQLNVYRDNSHLSVAIAKATSNKLLVALGKAANFR